MSLVISKRPGSPWTKKFLLQGQVLAQISPGARAEQEEYHQEREADPESSGLENKIETEKESDADGSSEDWYTDDMESADDDGTDGEEESEEQGEEWDEGEEDYESEDFEDEDYEDENDEDEDCEDEDYDFEDYDFEDYDFEDYEDDDDEDEDYEVEDFEEEDDEEEEACDLQNGGEEQETSSLAVVVPLQNIEITRITFDEETWRRFHAKPIEEKMTILASFALIGFALWVMAHALENIVVLVE